MGLTCPGDAPARRPTPAPEPRPEATAAMSRLTIDAPPGAGALPKPAAQRSPFDDPARGRAANSPSSCRPVAKPGPLHRATPLKNQTASVVQNRPRLPGATGECSFLHSHADSP